MNNIATRSISSAAVFFIKRLVRVMPLYAIFTIITVGISFWYFKHPFPHNVSIDLYYGPEKRPWEYLLKSLTFSNVTVAPVFTVGWTLDFEFWFYALFAVCIASRINVYAFFAVFVLVVLGLDYFDTPKVGVLAVAFSPLMFEFVLGIFLYPIWMHTKRLQTRGWFVAGLLILSAFFVLCDSDPYFSFITGHYRRVMLDGSAAFFLVYFFLSLDGRFKPSREFVFLGDASYSLYLGHWLLLTFTPYLFWRAGWFPNGSLAVYVFSSALAALAFGVAVHLLLERPINRALRPMLNDLGLWLKQKAAHEERRPDAASL